MLSFSDRMDSMEKSAQIMVGLFNSMTDPETISFSGGAPANEALPAEQLQQIAAEVLCRDSRGIEALQYSKPEGLKDLREIIADKLLKPKGILADPANVLVTGSGMETINFMCQAFINPGDVILVEAPTFVQSVEVFEMFQAKCVTVEMDDKGMIME